MTAGSSHATGAPNNTGRDERPSLQALVLLGLAALFAHNTSIERWLNRRLGAPSPGGRTVDEVAHGLAEVTPDAGTPTAGVTGSTPAADSFSTGGAAESEQVGAKAAAHVHDRQIRYLNSVLDDTKHELALAQSKVDKYEKYDLLVIRARLGAGAATLLLAIAGVLLVGTGYLPLGLVSGAIALIPGAGTVGLTKVTQLLGERLRTERRIRDTNRQTGRSVEALLTIGDQALLDAELSKLAREFAADFSTGNGAESV